MALLLSLSPALAHRLAERNGPPPQGLSIPSLTHGQMAVISDNLAAIRALARSRNGVDLTTWRLEDYLNLQSFACLWGLVPGSVADEGSPFNECAHAYLAAGRSLLLQLAKTPGVDRKAVDALTRKIEMEMIANGAALTLCRYSDEPFNSNEVMAALGDGPAPPAHGGAAGGGGARRPQRRRLGALAATGRGAGAANNRRLRPPLEFDALLPLDPGGEVMLDRDKLGHEVGGLDQRRLGVAARRHDMQSLAPMGERRDRLVERQIVVA